MPWRVLGTIEPQSLSTFGKKTFVFTIGKIGLHAFGPPGPLYKHYWHYWPTKILPLYENNNKIVLCVGRYFSLLPGNCRDPSVWWTSPWRWINRDPELWCHPDEPQQGSGDDQERRRVSVAPNSQVGSGDDQARRRVSVAPNSQVGSRVYQERRRVSVAPNSQVGSEMTKNAGGSLLFPIRRYGSRDDQERRRVSVAPNSSIYRLKRWSRTQAGLCCSQFTGIHAQ